MFVLSKEILFPPVELADEDGLLAIGGDLRPERLLAAYSLGIFPWYNEGEVIQWHAPDPRFVLFPEELQISKSMQQLIKKKRFHFTINSAFVQVMENCRDVNRPGQAGTWIHDEVMKAYKKLHDLGYAHSAEVWQDDKLVGGLYGIRLGQIFFGESMFSLVSNASKFAFIKYVQFLKEQQVVLIDCQVYTAHLESLGAVMIERKDFINLLTQVT